MLAILALIAYFTTKRGVAGVPRTRASASSPATQWDPERTTTSARCAFIYGTLCPSLIALVLAVPLSIGIALFTTELAPRRHAHDR